MENLAVEVLSSVTGERVCDFRCPGLTTIRDVKHRIATLEGTRTGRQSLFTRSASSPLGANVTLASLVADRREDQPGETLELMLLRHKWRCELRGSWKNDDFLASYALICAARDGCIDRVEQMLHFLTCPDVVDNHDNGCAPLHLVCGGGHLEIAGLLLEAGAEADKANYQGSTPLHFACREGHLEVARLLVEAGADKDKTDYQGFAALHLACMTGRLEVARLLVEAGADLDQTTRNFLLHGWTALHFACREGHLEIVRLLAEAGADREKVAKTEKPLCAIGVKASHLAFREGHLEIAQLLMVGPHSYDRQARGIFCYLTLFVFLGVMTAFMGLLVLRMILLFAQEVVGSRPKGKLSLWTEFSIIVLAAFLVVALAAQYRWLIVPQTLPWIRGVSQIARKLALRSPPPLWPRWLRGRTSSGPGGETRSAGVRT